MAALVLFGGGGDLAMRMLLPSLYFLEHDGLLPDGLKIIGAARSDESREVQQFSYTAWPDHGVPNTTKELLQFR